MLELAPWRPMRELTSLRREMDRLWEDFFGRRDLLAEEASWVPAVDISEDKEYVNVRAELPGIDPKDVEITLSGDLLTIRGEKKQRQEKKGENFHRIETRWGRFCRSIRIPVPVDPDKIEAKYENGVLNITMPKREEIKPKQIEIKTA